MMIIDSHVHLVDQGWIQEEFFLNMSRIVATNMGKQSGEYPDAQILLEGLKERVLDPTGDNLIEDMDNAGVDRSCIFAVDYGLAAGEPEVSIMEQNRAIAQAVQRYPHRLLGFFAIDPRRPEATEMFSLGVEDWGMQGLKLHPSVGYYPYEEVVYPLYEKCREYNVPVLIHTGNQPGPMKSRFCRPLYVDDVAADFPDLPIIMAHCGHHWWEEALLVCSVKPNCYVDISGWQRDFLQNPTSFYRILRDILDALGPWRVFFATDGPYLNVLCPMEQWVNAIKEPDLSSCPEISFSQEEIQIMMGKAFARLLNFDA